MTKKEMKDFIRAELAGLTNMEFMPGYRVKSLGHKYVTWINRDGKLDKAKIEQFYQGLTTEDNIYQIISEY